MWIAYNSHVRVHSVIHTGYVVSYSEVEMKTPNGSHLFVDGVISQGEFEMQTLYYDQLNRIANWVERPSPILGDCGFRTLRVRKPGRVKQMTLKLILVTS